MLSNSCFGSVSLEMAPIDPDWGHDNFRGPQLDICLASLRGMDLMVVAPTGLGKS